MSQPSALMISIFEYWISSLAREADRLISTDIAYPLLGLAAAAATLAVFIGLYLEYDRHEIRVFGLAKTRKLSFEKDFSTKALYRPSRKHVGGFLVVAGVALEALFGLAILRSGAARDTRNELQVASLQAQAAKFNKEAGEFHKAAADAQVQVEKLNAANTGLGKALLPRER